MISKYALLLACYFSEQNIYSKEKINVYKYGFELLISTAANSVVILLISIIMGETIGAMLFCMAFIPLRLNAGGYHTKHHWSCILGFNTLFLGVMVLHRYMNVKYTLPYSLTTIIVSSLLIWSFAPVEAINKPLTDTQRQKQRYKSVTIASVNLTFVLLFFFIPTIQKYADFFAYYSSGVFVASLFLLAAVFANRGNADVET